MLRAFALCLLPFGAFSATYHAQPQSVCSINGNGSAATCATSAGGAGAFSGITNAFAGANTGTAQSPDVVQVHAGTYTTTGPVQPLFPYVTLTLVDGDVTMQPPANSAIPNGHFFLPNDAVNGWVRDVHHITFTAPTTGSTAGKLASCTYKWIWPGVPGRSRVWGNSWERAGGTNGDFVTFECFDASQYDSGGIHMGEHMRLMRSEFHHMGWQGWDFYQAGRCQVRGARFYENDQNTNWSAILDNDPATLPNSPENADGVILQDSDDCIYEDVEAFGAYDGVDFGSQCSDQAGAPNPCSAATGPRRNIIRRARLHSNVNGQNPASDIRVGWLTYEYVNAWCRLDVGVQGTAWVGNDCGWAIAPIYSNSQQTEYWNVTYEDTRYVFSNTLTATRARFGFHNGLAIARLPFAQDQKGNLTDSGGTASWEFSYSRFWAILSGANMLNGPGNTSLTSADAAAARTAIGWTNAAARDYTLTATSPAIDAGRFMTHAATAGTNSTTLKTIRNPRRYFFFDAGYPNDGDTIQIQGVGTRKIVGLAGSDDPTIEGGTITLDAPATWTKGAGVHLPWCGAAPDQGAFERGLNTSTMTCN